MSEKRFVIDEEGISDNKTDNWYCWKEEVVDLLNEQQDIISKLKEENEQLRKELKWLNRKYIAFSEATDKRLKEMMR